MILKLFESLRDDLGKPLEISGSEKAGAVFSLDGRDRFCLWRIWNKDLPPCHFVGLNPSTATAFKLDPTCTREVNHAIRLGYGGYVKTNLCAYRSTDPRGLRSLYLPEEEHELNLVVIRNVAQNSGRTIACWGSNVSVPRWAPSVAKTLLDAVPEVWCFGTNGDGQPKHPLYLRGTADIRILLERPVAPGEPIERSPAPKGFLPWSEIRKGVDAPISEPGLISDNP